MPNYPTTPRLIDFTALWRRARGEKLFSVVDAADEARLRSIQGNVLKAHGRPHAALVMFQLGRTPARNRAFVRSWKTDAQITSTWDQLNDQWDFKAAQASVPPPADPTPAEAGQAPFCTVALTQTGLEALSLRPAMHPTDTAFTSKMESPDSRYKLGDMPNFASAGTDDDPWQADGYLERIDVIVLLAHATPAGLEALIIGATERGLRFGTHPQIKVEKGFAWNPDGIDPREPFGFVDGITNPVFLKEDAAKLPGSPMQVPWNQVIIDYQPIVAGGSFLVYRKLEQDTEAFKKFEAELAPHLAGRVQGDAAEVLIGRDRSGAPLISPGARGRNDFDYQADQVAPGRCPFHAHIRKANPRTGSSQAFVRRSLVYAEQGDPKSPQLGGKRGLLFLAYMSRIDSQFRAMQESWLLNEKSQEPGLGVVGVDPLLAPKGTYTLSHRSMKGGPAEQISLERPRLVIPRGGRYAFLPGLAWFDRLPV